MPKSTPSVLFLCVANSCRSQMAEAIAKRRYPDAVIDSAGDSPASEIHPRARHFLEKKGYALSDQRPKTLEAVMSLKSYDAVIGLCDEACVLLPPSIGAENWGLADPSLQGSELAFQQTYAELEAKIDDLFGRLRG